MNDDKKDFIDDNEEDENDDREDDLKRLTNYLSDIFKGFIPKEEFIEFLKDDDINDKLNNNEKLYQLTLINTKNSKFSLNQIQSLGHLLLDHTGLFADTKLPLFIQGQYEHVDQMILLLDQKKKCTIYTSSRQDVNVCKSNILTGFKCEYCERLKKFISLVVELKPINK